MYEFVESFRSEFEIIYYIFFFYRLITVKAKYGDVAVNESDSSSEEEDDNAEVTVVLFLIQEFL